MDHVILNVKLKTVEHLEENIEPKLHTFGCGSDFLEETRWTKCGQEQNETNGTM